MAVLRVQVMAVAKPLSGSCWTSIEIKYWAGFLPLREMAVQLDLPGVGIDEALGPDAYAIGFFDQCRLLGIQAALTLAADHHIAVVICIEPSDVLLSGSRERLARYHWRRQGQAQRYGRHRPDAVALPQGRGQAARGRLRRFAAMAKTQLS